MFGIIPMHSRRVQEKNVGKKRKRQRQLDTAVATIRRRYGSRALIQGKPATATGGVPHIPTGFSALDRALGIGGLPKGRVCELVGPATSGKTTLALKFLDQAQAFTGVQAGIGMPDRGEQVAYVDQALYFDPDYAHRCGLDLSRLLVGTSHDLREALAMTEALIHSGGLAAVVFDALDFLWTDPEAASLLAASLNRLPAALSHSGTTLLILHESSSDDTSPASASLALSALAHYAAVRLQVIREEWIYRQSDIRGYKARVKVLKNRWGPAGRAVTLTIEFNGTVRGNGL
jgi:recombination protein RecA